MVTYFNLKLFFVHGLHILCKKLRLLLAFSCLKLCFFMFLKLKKAYINGIRTFLFRLGGQAVKKASEILNFQMHPEALNPTSVPLLPTPADILKERQGARHTAEI